jgi:hypothetical protein
MATSQSETTLAVQRTLRALDRVSQNLDVFCAELEERAQPVPRMIRSPNDLATSILADRRLSRSVRAVGLLE